MKQLGDGVFSGTSSALRIQYSGDCLPVAIRLACAYPEQAVGLTLERLIILYAKSPVKEGGLLKASENDAISDVEVAKLDGIQKAYSQAIVQLLIWLTKVGLLVE